MIYDVKEVPPLAIIGLNLVLIMVVRAEVPVPAGLFPIPPTIPLLAPPDANIQPLTYMDVSPPNPIHDIEVPAYAASFAG